MTQQRVEPNPSSKVIRHVGTLWGNDVGGLATSVFVADGMEGDTEAGIINSAVGAVIGILVSGGVLIHRKIKRLKSNHYNPVEPLELVDDKNNPWNARIKAGVVFGEGIGRSVFVFLPIPLAEKPLLMLGGAVGGFIGGIVALFIPGWKPSIQNPAQRTELNPSSERIRSGAMYGSCVGIVLAVIFVAIANLLLPGFGMGAAWDISTIVFLGSGIGAALGSIIAYLIDSESFFDKVPEVSEESAFNATQNPWSKRVRAGVQWGACLGILLGVLLPGLGLGLSIGLSAIVGGALFSVLGGIVSLVVEPLVTNFLTPSVLVSQNDYRTVNPWVPRCRAGVAWGTCLGMFIGCLLFPDFLGATAGGAIGGLAGGLVAVVIEPLYLCVMRLLEREENYKNVDSDDPGKATPNPWAERCRTATLVGAALGALIGYFLFPPLGVFLGGAMGGAVSGVLAFFLPSSEIESDIDVDSPIVYENSNASQENQGNTKNLTFNTLNNNPLNGSELTNNLNLKAF